MGACGLQGRELCPCRGGCQPSGGGGAARSPEGHSPLGKALNCPNVGKSPVVRAVWESREQECPGVSLGPSFRQPTVVLTFSYIVSGSGTAGFLENQKRKHRASPGVSAAPLCSPSHLFCLTSHLLPQPLGQSSQRRRSWRAAPGVVPQGVGVKT